jgi:hypothetical protein
MFDLVLIVLVVLWFPCWISILVSPTGKEGVLKIDRSKPFDFRMLPGTGWKMDEEDDRSVARNEIVLDEIRLEVIQEKDETIGGEERLRRLKRAGFLRLDAKVLEEFLKHQDKIPEEWKESGSFSYPPFVCFDGSIVSDPDGVRLVLCMSWSRFGNQWRLGALPLSIRFSANERSAVLVK